MMTAKKILFPTDFTSRSERAFAHATHLAESHNAELHVLNVIVQSDSAPGDPMEHLELEEQSSDTWSDAFKIGQDADARVVHAQVRINSPAAGILQYAERHDIDLIVMATHGRKGLDHFLLGSVAEEVVRQADCPVFTIRNTESAQNAGQWTSILVPIDFSESSEMTLRHAKELTQSSGARLYLLHVIEEAVFPTIYGIDPVAVAVPQVIKRSEESLDEMAERILGGDVSYVCRVAIGHPVKEIVDFAERTSIDLITIATHGLTGLQRLLIGSVTEKVIRLAPSPVLTVKSFGKALVESEGEGGRLQQSGEARNV